MSKSINCFERCMIFNTKMLNNTLYTNSHTTYQYLVNSFTNTFTLTCQLQKACWTFNIPHITFYSSGTVYTFYESYKYSKFKYSKTSIIWKSINQNEFFEKCKYVVVYIHSVMIPTELCTELNLKTWAFMPKLGKMLNMFKFYYLNNLFLSISQFKSINIHFLSILAKFVY